MKTLKIIILLILVITVSNCSKSDDDNSQVPPVESIRLKNYTKEGVNFDITYNENNQLFKYQYGNTSPITSTIQYDAQGNIASNGGYSFNYNAQDKINSISSSILNSEMSYNIQGLLTSMDSHYTYTTTDITAVTNFEYDSTNRINTIIEYSDDFVGSPYAKTTLTYDANGNIIEQLIERSNDGADYYHFRTEYYTYDTKNNPYFNVINRAGLEDGITFQDFNSLRTLAFSGQIGRAFISFFSPNNLLSVEDIFKIISYDYTYNEHDYPITATETYDDSVSGGEASTTSLTWTYEMY